jgi:Cd2+/Zn2+-exporting ATPase
MTTQLLKPSAGERLGFRVDGMDCASCVGKIETALGRLGGISDVTVNFANETLLLSRDPASQTTSKHIAKKIRSLGFDVTELPASAVPAASDLQSNAHSAHNSGCGGHDRHHHHDHHVHDHSAHDHHGACGDGHKHAHAHHDHDGHDHAAHAAVPRVAPVSPPNVSMRVEGMDCASCVGKIEVALARMPDVSDVRVNFTTETLELTLAAASIT